MRFISWKSLMGVSLIALISAMASVLIYDHVFYPLLEGVENEEIVTEDEVL